MEKGYVPIRQRISGLRKCVNILAGYLGLDSGWERVYGGPVGHRVWTGDGGGETQEERSGRGAGMGLDWGGGAVDVELGAGSETGETVAVESGRCQRCEGLLVERYVVDVEGGEQGWLWGCVNCGEYVDAVVLAHRQQRPEVRRRGRRSAGRGKSGDTI